MTLRNKSHSNCSYNPDATSVGVAAGYDIKSIFYHGEDVAEEFRTTFSIYPKSLLDGEGVYEVEALSFESVLSSLHQMECS